MRRIPVKRLLFWILILFNASCFSQTIHARSDMEILGICLKEQLPAPVKSSWIYDGETKWIKKYNPAGWLIGGTLYVYQKAISRHVSADCLFTPGCPEFSGIALKEEGILKGTIISIERLSRCNRIAGLDLRHRSPDPITGLYPDSLSRYFKFPDQNEE